MDNLIAVFAILVVIGFFASIGTGATFLVLRSKAGKGLRKGFYSSVGVFFGALVLMIVSLFSLDDNDDSEVATEKNSSNETQEVANISEEKPPVFTYDDTVAVADAKGNFTLPINVEEGYTAELEPSSVIKSTGTLEKKDETTYILSGTIVPEEVTEMYSLTFKKDGMTEEDIVFIDNEILNNAYGEQQLAAVKEEENKEAIANEKSISYGMLNKSREGYVGERYHISKGQVLQAEEIDGETNLLVNIKQDGYGYWDDLVHVRLFGTTDAVENDIIEVYAILNEKLDYSTQIGGTNSVPSMNASEIKVISNGN